MLTDFATEINQSQDDYRYKTRDAVVVVAKRILSSADQIVITLSNDVFEEATVSSNASGDSVTVWRYDSDNSDELEQLIELTSHLVLLDENDGDEIELDF